MNRYETSLVVLLITELFRDHPVVACSIVASNICGEIKLPKAVV